MFHANPIISPPIKIKVSFFQCFINSLPPKPTPYAITKGSHNAYNETGPLEKTERPIKSME